MEALARCEARGAGTAVVPLVVAHLTDRGLLDADPADLAARHALPVGDVEEAVRAVRTAGPPGIAQRTVRDLLRAQAEDLAERGLDADQEAAGPVAAGQWVRRGDRIVVLGA